LKLQIYEQIFAFFLNSLLFLLANYSHGCNQYVTSEFLNDKKCKIAKTKKWQNFRKSERKSLFRVGKDGKMPLIWTVKQYTDWSDHPKIGFRDGQLRIQNRRLGCQKRLAVTWLTEWLVAAQEYLWSK
jgi:hypothetical protein